MVVSDLHIGPGNLVNLEAVLQAQQWGKMVYLFSPRPIEERDHTGGKACELYGRLLAAGAMESPDREDVFKMLAGKGRGAQ